MADESVTSEDLEPGTLPHHLDKLAADADDVVAMLTAQHQQGGDIHPGALAKSEKVATSLREVIQALTHHEHLAMTSDDVWKALGRQHESRDDGTIS